MLKIWGRINSINVQKVLWAVTELGVEHQRTDAGMQYGGVNEPWYRAMNPNGRVPTIDDAGFVLWESNVIVRYLAAKHGAGSLCPAHLQTRAEADRWMDWATTTIAPVLTPLFWGLIRTAPEKRDLKAIEDERKKTEGVMAILDAHLANRAFVAGEAFTMGDIPVGCFAYRWSALPMERAPLPNLARWMERLGTRDGYRKFVAQPLT